MQVVMHHVIDNIAKEPPTEEAHPKCFRKDKLEKNIEKNDDHGCWYRWENQAGVIKGRLMVLAMQQEMQSDKVIVAGRLHVEDEAVDDVFH